MTTANVATLPIRARVIPRLMDFAQTLIGRLALFVIFTALMWATRVQAYRYVAVILLCISLAPELRRLLVTLAAIAWIFVFPPTLTNPLTPNQLQLTAARHLAEHWLSYWPACVAAVWIFIFVYVYIVRRFPKSIVGRRPITWMILILVTLYAIQQYVNGFAWFAIAMCAIVMGNYIWFFAYTLSDLRRPDGTPRPVQPGFWRPFWAINKCPIGKGAGYLERVEAKNDAQFALSQLKGLKLMINVTILSVVKVLADNILYGPNSDSITHIPHWNPRGFIPTYEMTFQAHLAGHPYSWHICWMALIAHFLLIVLYVSIWGNKLIAIARMAGYNAFRTTYKPLASTSIADFYNRFHWYFKEMLVVFFFYPTYLRYLKRWPKLRLFVATVAAAGVGNFIYHFLHYDRNIFAFGLWHAFVGYQTYAVYALILSIGIGISQLRTPGHKKEVSSPLRTAIAIVGVMIFFCILSIFDETSATITLGQYASYTLRLFYPWA